MRQYCRRNVMAVILLSYLGLQLCYTVIGSISHMTHLQEVLADVSNKIGISDDLQKSKFLTLNMRDTYLPLGDNSVTARNVVPHKYQTPNQPLNILTNNNLSILKNETVKNDMKLQNNVTGNIFPHKVFIYELPGKFSGNLIDCMSRTRSAKCYDMADFGYGRQLYTDHGMSVRATWQFSLELIIHNKLLHSPHRTKNASEASMFYVPFYGALASFCYPLRLKFNHVTDSINFTEYAGGLSMFLMQQTPFQDGRPHLMTIGKIEREMRTVGYPIIPRSHIHHMVFVGIEQEINDEYRKFYTPGLLPLIVAPYPSYGHLLGKSGNTYTYLETLYREPRNVFILLAASTRRSNPFRGILLDQFADSATRVGYTEYFATRYNGNMTDMVWLQTEECNNQHENETMSWMKRSVFCLQPSGDSPTRKSFYDAVMAGCIPVIFRANSHVVYPFESELDYASFTVTINETEAMHSHVTRILAQYKTIYREKVKRMQRSILNVLPWLQYTYPPDHNGGPDALDMILQEALNRFNIS